MANDAVFRSSLVCLAVVVVIVGICTQSLKKMMVTYLVGVVGIGGVLLPDWGYFDRDFSRWSSPVTVEERASAIATAQRSGLARLVAVVIGNKFLLCFFLLFIIITLEGIEL